MLSALGGALLIGILMGTCGAGGGILTVPLLVAALGMRMQEAAPIALVAICCSASLGALDALRRGIARYRAAILIALVSLPFSALGIHWAAGLSQTVLMFGFAFICLISAARILYATMRSENAPALPNVGLIHPQTGRYQWSAATAAVMFGVGATSGTMTGLFGVGGGFVIVPMLQRLTHLSMLGTVATSLLVMAMVSCGGVIAALAHGIRFPLLLTASIAASMTVGLVIGRLLAPRLPATQIKRIFAGAVLLIGCAMLVAALRH